MTKARISLIYHATQAPDRHLIFEQGRVVERGLRASEAEAGSVRDVLVVPGAQVAAHWLHLPTRNVAEAFAAARLALVDQVALSQEAPHIALGPLEDDGRRLVLVVAKDVLQAWLDGAAACGLAPSLVIPDYLALPAQEGDELIAGVFTGLLAVRGRRLALSLEPDLVDLVLEGRSFTKLEGPGDVEAALGQALALPAVNLLQGEFDPLRDQQLDWRNLRRAAALAAVLLVSIPLVFGAGALRNHLAANRLEAQADRAAASVLAKERVVRDPVAQTSARLRELQLAAGGGPSGLTAGLFAALEDIEASQVESLTLSPDGTLRARVSFNQITDLELLRGALRAAKISAREEATEPQGARMVSDLVLGDRS